MICLGRLNRPSSEGRHSWHPRSFVSPEQHASLSPPAAERRAAIRLCGSRTALRRLVRREVVEKSRPLRGRSDDKARERRTKSRTTQKGPPPAAVRPQPILGMGSYAL